MIIGIIAVSRNFAIGREGTLPWHYPADLKFFRQQTSGNTVVMGFETWTSIGKALPKRLNVVLSRTRTAPSGAITARSIEDVVMLSSFLNGDVFVIGGAKTYQAFAPAIERWIVTEIPEVIEDADVFMPPDFLDGFTVDQTIDLDGGLRVKSFVKKVDAL